MADVPFQNAKREERLEAIESLYFLSIILSTGEDTPSVSKMPEGPTSYIPYYDPPSYLTAPKCTSAASLAMAAKYFRCDTHPELQFHVFRFEVSVKDWVASPDGAQMESERSSIATEAAAGPQAAASPSNQLPTDALTDEQGYRRIAQVSGNNSTMHGAVSYFMLKLFAIMKQHSKVMPSVCSIA
jgi:hypothetical protein